MPKLQQIIAAHGFKGSKPTKYRNRKVEVDGIIFDSAKEARRHAELLLLEKAGHISGLERQRVFILAPAVVLGGRKKPALKYKADFFYTMTLDGAEVVEDTKGMITDMFRIKQHLMKSVHNIDILLT